MTLTQFEWVLITAIGVVLISIIAWFAARMLSAMREDIRGEAAARERGDLKLASILEGITHELNAHKVWDTETHGNLVGRDEMIKAEARTEFKIDALHKRLDEIRDLLALMREQYVRKEDCRERCAAGVA